MGYCEYFGHRVWDEDQPMQPEPRTECPACSAEISADDLCLCEWCGRMGCEECMKVAVDGRVCKDDACEENLRKYQEAIDLKWDEWKKRNVGIWDIKKTPKIYSRR